MSHRIGTALAKLHIGSIGGLVAVLVPMAVVLSSIALSPRGNHAELLVLAGFCVLAMARPADAMLVTAALVGFGIILSVLMGVPGLRVPEFMVVASISGYCVRAIARPAFRSALASQTAAPVALLALTAVAAGLVALRVHQVQTDYPDVYLRSLVSFLAHHYFTDPDRYFELVGIATIVEGLALFTVVAALCRVESAFFQRAVRMLAVGGAALSVMSVVRFAEIILRDPRALHGLRVTRAGVRISPQIPDYIAAGGYFALCWLAVLGIAIAARRRRVAWIAIAGVPLLIGVYLTGSRSSVFALLAGLGALAGMLLGQRNPATRRVIGFAAVVVGIVLLSFSWMVGHDLLGSTARDSLTVRVELVKTGLQVLATRPLFGVGVGRFHVVAGAFVSPELSALWTGRMNAHNDFLRIGAELGLVGLVFFVWILVSAGTAIWRALRRSREPYLAGLAAGLIAFLVTSFVSNPLMLPDISHMFWIALGLATGGAGLPAAGAPAAPGEGSPSAPPRLKPRVRQVLIALVGALVLASIPFRAAQDLAGVDLTAVTYGLQWRADSDGTAYRWSGPRATLFVDGRARLVEIPISGTSPSGAQRVEIRVNGRPADRLDVGREWQRLRVVLPPQASASARRIDILVSPVSVPPPTKEGNDDARGAGVKLGDVRVLIMSDQAREPR